MFTLPILPEEIKIPLDRYQVEGTDKEMFTICEYPGVTAFARPFDVEAASRYNDSVNGAPNTRSLAATAVVQRNLIRIEGLMMKVPGSPQAEPFKADNVAHMRSIPMDMRDAIYLAIRKRANLSEETEKNFGLPSDSGGTRSGETSPAATAASGQETP